MLSDRCLSVCPVCPVLSVTLVYCGQTVEWINIKLGMQVGLGPGHIVLDGDPAPHPQRGTASNFWPVCCGQTAGWIKMSLGTEVGLGPSHIVLDGRPRFRQKGHSPPIFGACLLWPTGWMDQYATCYRARPLPKRHCVTWRPSSAPKKRHSPHFLSHVYCGQTAGWIKMPLDTKVGLGPGHIVLDGDPAPQRGTYPIFSPCLLWPNDRQSQLLLGSCYATLKRYKEFKIANVKFS